MFVLVVMVNMYHHTNQCLVLILVSMFNDTTLDIRT